MPDRITDADLEAYLEEALPEPQMAALEAALRGDRNLVARLAEIQTRRDQGAHSLGAIWRRERLTCLDRGALGSYLLGALPRDAADYARFHLEIVGCRYCQANLRDLQAQQGEPGEQTAVRRRRYFQSSAGYLRNRR